MESEIGEKSHPPNPPLLERFAWLPIPILLAAIIAGRFLGLNQSYTNETLTLGLSAIFYTLVSLVTLVLIGRNFLASGKPGLLLLECGVLLWSLSGTVGDAVSHGDANANVTIFNIGILLSGFCHLAGALLSLRPRRALSPRPLWLGAAGILVLGVLWLIARAALAKWLPVFFIPGQGGTIVRYLVLLSAIFMFALSALLLNSGHGTERTSFISWYVFALLLLAVGLFGIMIQLSLGCIVNWLSRSAQWLGGFYLFIASIAALRESDLSLFRIDKNDRSRNYRYGVAVTLVLASAAFRMVFLSFLETRLAYLTFYPVIALASLYGGFQSGLAATVLSGFLAGWLFVPSKGFFVFSSAVEWLGMLIFLLSGWLISWVSEAMHRAIARASAAEAQALLAAERESAAKELQKSEEQYHALFTGMTEGFAIHELLTDEDGNPVDYRFLDLNPAFERLTGLKREAVVGRTHNEVLPGNDPKWLQMFSQVALSGQPAQFENYSPALKRHYEAFAYRPAPMQFAVIFMDITERKQAEETLKKAHDELEIRVQERTAELSATVDRLEKANKELEEFAYIASHDLQEPLRKIQTFGDMARKRCLPLADKMGRDYLDRVLQSAGRMRQLLQELLALSRVTSMKEPFKEIELTKLAREAANVFEAVIQETGGQIKIENLAMIEADEGQMRQLFQNLIGNALKFRDDQIPLVRINGRVIDQGLYEITVRDNGIGFDPEFAEIIFKPFERLHGQSIYAGTGMGLAICRKIVERHGGTIRAESEAGKGAAFFIRLPIKQTRKEIH